MPGFLSFVAAQRSTLPVAKAPADVQERTYVVTGANTGLGYECAKHLIAFSAGRVILASRSIPKGEAALAEIRHETGRHSAGEVWQLDLESLDSVEAFSKRLSALDRLDALVENAGIARLEYIAVDGIESGLLVNVVSTFLLALRALPKLQETAKKFGTKSNLAIVSSETGLASDVKNKFDGLEGNLFETLSDPATMDRSRYPFTKQLDTLLTRTLASLFPVHESNVVINVVNPGFCHSELARNASKYPVFWVMMKMMKFFLARSTEMGSRNLLYAAVASPDTHGKYLSACAPRDDHLPAWLIGDVGAKKQQRVWDDLLQLLEAKGHAVDMSISSVKA